MTGWGENGADVTIPLDLHMVLHYRYIHGSSLCDLLLCPPGGVRNIVMSMSVCLSVCLYASVTQKPRDRTLSFLHMLPIWT